MIRVPWVFNTWFWGRPGIVDFWGLGGSGGPTNQSRRWGAKPPTFWNCFLGLPGPPKPNQITISGRPQKPRTKNPGVYRGPDVTGIRARQFSVPVRCDLWSWTLEGRGRGAKPSVFFTKTPPPPPPATTPQDPCCSALTRGPIVHPGPVV